MVKGARELPDENLDGSELILMSRSRVLICFELGYRDPPLTLVPSPAYAAIV